MTTLTASSSRRVDAGFAVAATLVAVTLFLVGWGVLHRGFFADRPIVDTPTYERYGSAMDDGQVPYRDFAVEYPPGALPVFAIPALGDPSSETYRVRFEALMAFFGQAMIVALAVALVALGASRRWLLGGLAFAALAPVLLGPVVLSRFDLWPAALTAAALCALVTGRFRLGHVALGAAVVAKLYPAVLAPLTVAYVWKREGRREALVCSGLMLAVVAVVFAPFVAVAPGGVWDSLWNQASRPAPDREPRRGGLAGRPPRLRDRGHDGVEPRLAEPRRDGAGGAGRPPDASSSGRRCPRRGSSSRAGPATRERLLLASAAALVAFIALGKVLSPQFLIWLIPVIPLVAGRRGLIASGLLAAALVLTQLWFPYRYLDLALEFGALESWLVLVRDLVLVALFAWLVWALLDREPEGLAARRAA